MKKVILALLLITAVSQFSFAQKTAKYSFSNSLLSQVLQVKWLTDKKVTFTYTIKEKNDAGKLNTTIYKGNATSLGGDGETDEDIDGAYDVDEFKYKLKNCEVFLRIAADKSKCIIKSGGCNSKVTVDSFDTMIKR